MSASERVCLALDLPSRAEVLAAARRFERRAGWFKIGLEAFVAEGPGLVHEVAAYGKVFLDLKLHDIPRTVGRAVAAAAQTGAELINVHALGGREMLLAARGALPVGTPPRLIAVTLLTSLDARALADLPVAGYPEGITRRLARLAKDCGLDGVVCAAADLPAIRTACGTDFFTAVPGIRPSGEAAGDQKRIATAREAIAVGADLLVVGRPVLDAPEPDLALDALLAEIESAA